MKKALITGAGGQDGTYLIRYLLQRGYTVLGIDRQPLRVLHENLSYRELDFGDIGKLTQLLSEWHPDEIYHLAACHYAAEDLPEKNDTWLFKESYEIHALTTACLLEWMAKSNKQSRLFYAASCHLFGIPEDSIQNEQTLFKPNCIYSITKHTGVLLCRYYRQSYGVFASVGILYHHESPLRNSRFVSKKIVQAAVAIKQKRQQQLLLGDLSIAVDWGYAGDYVRAMHSILQHEKSDDFIISSGRDHTILEFVTVTFDYLGLNWKNYVVEDASLIKKKDKGVYRGDNTKIVQEVGWVPVTSFHELIKIMVDAEMSQDEQQ